MLNLVKIRVIINGRNIYTVEKNKLLVIPVPSKNSQIVATDGYHYTKPLELACHHINTCYFKIVCAIDDNQLATGGLLLVLFYAIGFTSEILFIRFLSFIPIFYFLYVYYTNRANFIQIKVATSH